ncbi:MAG: site-specific integrase [Nitrospira sp.]|nr:site-specific integrase [Nitrospira sp.]
MAKATRDSKLETRTARAKLKVSHHPYFKLIGESLHLGYRKGKRGGKWLVRYYDGGQYQFKTLAETDDFRDSNGVDVLTYFEAQDKARHYADECVYREKNIGTPGKPITINDAIEKYLSWYRIHKKAYKETENAINTHILPVFGGMLISEITTKEIRKWHEELALKSAQLRSGKGGRNLKAVIDNADGLRKRKATANRILTVLKALLNHAWHEGLAVSDAAWRPVKPFHNVDAPKIRHITEEEATRLINCCKPDIKTLVLGALHTGGRYGELTAMKCNDYNPESGTVYFSETKNGKPRHVPITEEGQGFFETITAGRPGDDVLFKRANGEPWGKSGASRPVKDACKLAKIVPAISFHILRHSYASLLAMKGVPLQVIAEVIGHSDTRITSKHYAHLSPNFVADTIRANLPGFGAEKSNVTLLKLRAKANE